MAWETSDLKGMAEASPFVTTARERAPFVNEDPIAASSVFAARGSEAFTTSDMEEEEEEIRDALPGHALEETLRAIHDEELELGEVTVSGEDEEPAKTPAKVPAKTPAPLPPGVKKAVDAGLITDAAARAMVAGERNENKLTDMIFFERHPTLDPKQKLKPGQDALRDQWGQIRDNGIRPVLRGLTEGFISSLPFKAPPALAFASNATFSSCLAAAVPAELRVAVVDLTDPAAPVYAGVRDKETIFAASMAKVAPLYAAFELKDRVNEAIADVPEKVPVEHIVENIQRAWQPLLDAKKPKDAAAFTGFPLLTEIFKFELVAIAGRTQKQWQVSFAPGGGKFKELLDKMARFSSDDAAARCITALSYEYLNAALVTAGFYEPATGGMWVGASYGRIGDPRAPDRDRLWMKEPKMTQANQQRRFQVGSAKSFATMFTLMAKGKLVGAGPSNDMLTMLITAIGDPIKDALVAASRGIFKIHTKIGYIRPADGEEYLAQTSFVQRDVMDRAAPTKRVQYVISILNQRLRPSFDGAVISAIDQCILNRH